MKKLFFIPVLGILLSCNSNFHDRTTSQQKGNKLDSVKTASMPVTKKDDFPGSLTPVTNLKETYLSKNLIGTWAKQIGENATLEISKTEFYYPEHSSSYKYTVVGDSIKIKYDDFEGSFAFKFKNKDILILQGMKVKIHISGSSNFCYRE